MLTSPCNRQPRHAGNAQPHEAPGVPVRFGADPSPEGATFGVSIRIKRHAAALGACRPLYIASDARTGKPLVVGYSLADTRTWALAQCPAGAIEYDLGTQTQ